METLRTFVALVLPEAACHVIECEQQDLASRVSGVKWTKSHTVHATLFFLGQTSSAAISKIATVVRDVATGCKPINFTLQGLGAFPNAHNPKVVWAGMRNCEALLDLQQQLADGLGVLGFQKDKNSFKGHITLGRVREGSARSALSALLDERHNQHFGEFLAERLAFIHSDLQSSGPVYTLLEEFKL